MHMRRAAYIGAPPFNCGVRRRGKTLSTTFVPAANIRNPEVSALVAEAVGFVRRHQWCGQVHDVQLAFAIAGVLAVVRVDLEPLTARAEPRVWVIAGDLPSAYIVYEEGDTWQDALRGYVYEMRRWGEAAQRGAPVDDLIPVNVAPSPEHVGMLLSRLTFIEQELLSHDAEELESDR
jgi:hypothetical protein